ERVSRGRERLAGGSLRGEPDSPAGGGLPDARLAERGRRRRAGVVAPLEPLRYERGAESRRLAHDCRRARLPGHAPGAEVAPRGAAGCTDARTDREPSGWGGPGAGG